MGLGWPVCGPGFRLGLNKIRLDLDIKSISFSGWVKVYLSLVGLGPNYKPDSPLIKVEL